MKVTIYANYGVLAAEKRCVYTFPCSAETADVSERIDVIIPDKYAPYETETGNIVLTIGGCKYLLREVLCGDDYPCITIPGPFAKYERLARA
nr:MAG TPA: hypothetical protein [Caudoviricetes sp.]